MYILVRSQRATSHTLQNVSEVNREHSHLGAASSVCDSTKHNGLVTLILAFKLPKKRHFKCQKNAFKHQYLAF